MFHLLVTILTDVISSLRFTRVLEFAAITVVLMLFSSPTAVFSTLGIGAKLGIASFAMNPDEDDKD